MAAILTAWVCCGTPLLDARCSQASPGTSASAALPARRQGALRDEVRHPPRQPVGSHAASRHHREEPADSSSPPCARRHAAHGRRAQRRRHESHCALSQPRARQPRHAVATPMRRCPSGLAILLARDRARCSEMRRPTSPVNPRASIGNGSAGARSRTTPFYQTNPGLAPAADVPKLKVKWAFRYPGSRKTGRRPSWASAAVRDLHVRRGLRAQRKDRLRLLALRRGSGDALSVHLASMPAGSKAKTALFYSDWTKSAVAVRRRHGRAALERRRSKPKPASR